MRTKNLKSPCFTLDLKINKKIIKLEVKQNDTHAQLVKKICQLTGCKNQLYQKISHNLNQQIKKNITDHGLSLQTKKKLQELVVDGNIKIQVGQKERKDSPVDTPFKYLQTTDINRSKSIKKQFNYIPDEIKETNQLNNNYQTNQFSQIFKQCQINEKSPARTRFSPRKQLITRDLSNNIRDARPTYQNIKNKYEREGKKQQYSLTGNYSTKYISSFNQNRNDINQKQRECGQYYIERRMKFDSDKQFIRSSKENIRSKSKQITYRQREQSKINRKMSQIQFNRQMHEISSFNQQRNNSYDHFKLNRQRSTTPFTSGISQTNKSSLQHLRWTQAVVPSHSSTRLNYDNYSMESSGHSTLNLRRNYAAISENNDISSNFMKKTARKFNYLDETMQSLLK